MSGFFKNLILQPSRESAEVEVTDNTENVEHAEIPESNPNAFDVDTTEITEIQDQEILDEAQGLEEAEGDLVAAQSDVQLLESGSEILGASDPKAETFITKAAVESLANIIDIMRKRYEIAGVSSISKESLSVSSRLDVAKEAILTAESIKEKAMAAWERLVQWFKDLWDRFFASSARRVKALKALADKAITAGTGGKSHAGTGLFPTRMLVLAGKPTEPVKVAQEVGVMADILKQTTNRLKGTVEREYDISSIDFNPRLVGNMPIVYRTKEQGYEKAEGIEIALGSPGAVAEFCKSLSKALEEIAATHSDNKKYLVNLKRMFQDSVTFRSNDSADHVFTDRARSAILAQPSAFLWISSKVLGLAMRVSSEGIRWAEASLSAAGGQEAPRATKVDSVDDHNHKPRTDKPFSGGRFQKAADVTDVKTRAV